MDPPRYVAAEELMRRSPLPVTKPYGRYFFIAFVVVPSAVTLTLLFVSAFVKHELVPYVVVAATVYGLFAGLLFTYGGRPVSRLRRFRSGMSTRRFSVDSASARRMDHTVRSGPPAASRRLRESSLTHGSATKSPPTTRKRRWLLS